MELKVFGIEWCLVDKWYIWKWYLTEKSRDQAIRSLVKSSDGLLNTTKYRKRDR